MNQKRNKFKQDRNLISGMNLFLLTLLLLSGLLFFLAHIKKSKAKEETKQEALKQFEERVRQTESGYDLSPTFKEKMNREMKGLANAEQYALRASKDGFYECATCLAQYGQAEIFLLKDEVWRYGVSTKGDLRYEGGFYRKKGVYYDTEFEGNYYECLIEEKKKIYYYVILPENLKREIPLIRPPMNLRSN